MVNNPQILFLYATFFLASPLNLHFHDLLSLGIPNIKSFEQSSDCFTIIQNLKTPNTTSDIILRDLIYSYSGHNFQDLGDFQACNNFSNLQYITVNVTIESQLTVYSGICGPSQCDASDYAIIADFINLPPELQSAQFEFLNPKTYLPQNTQGFVIALFIIGLVVILNIVGTALAAIFRTKNSENKVENNMMSANPINDSLAISLINDQTIKNISGEQLDSLPKKICECFDIFSNYEDFLHDDKNPQHIDSLRVFNGIRVLSFCWVVFGHSSLFMFQFAKNIAGIESFFNDVWFLTVYGGFFAVDIFYFLSGFFAGFILIQKAKSMPPSIRNYCKILIHRLLRIWPSYAICILFFWQVLPWLGSGPIWYNQIQSSQICDGSWWKNMLFIDNFFGKNSDLCFDWGWYLSTDFQIFLIVPFIIWIYHRDKDMGRSILWILIIISICAGYYESIKAKYYYSIPVNVTAHFWDDFYINPVVRASPYLIGVFVGIMYKKYLTGEESNIFNLIKRNQYVKTLFSIFGLAITLLMVYFPRVLQNGGEPWPIGFAYSWIALNRPIYILGLFLFISPVLSGNFAFIKDILGNGMFNILAKLTFTMYLVHYQILEYTFWSDSNMTDFTGMTSYMRTIAAIVLSVFFGLIVHIFVEKPFSNLEIKILNPKPQNNMKKKGDPEEFRMAKDYIQDLK